MDQIAPAVAEQETKSAGAARYTGSVSVVIPVLNEVESLRPLHEALTKALNGYDYELVFVDDGSDDGSQERMVELVKEDPDHTVMVELRRNFGQTAAISAGVDHARGEVIVLIDADLQNDPADIPTLLTKIAEG
ncbi:MAG: glycosyltransferase, partial [Anaerolineales bacterium]